MAISNNLCKFAVLNCESLRKRFTVLLNKKTEFQIKFGITNRPPSPASALANLLPQKIASIAGDYLVCAAKT